MGIQCLKQISFLMVMMLKSCKTSMCSDHRKIWEIWISFGCSPMGTQKIWWNWVFPFRNESNLWFGGKLLHNFG